MTHLDLFSGIGGFALAADRVFDDVEHIFVEIDPFCQKVLRKHWKESEIYGDIRTITNTEGARARENEQGVRCLPNRYFDRKQTYLLTGGFPCQPFSQAGKRGGTADNRYLWPEMFRVIREFQPTWIIAENVRGLLTWNEGLVFEQVCADLENEGYEVQPFIIPACSLNAPHRRDRVWFVANRTVTGRQGNGLQRQGRSGQPSGDGKNEKQNSIQLPSWDENWTEIAAELCRMDDGIPSGLDEFSGYTKARHRQERLKALGNAIVPQVAEQIMRGML